MHKIYTKNVSQFKKCTKVTNAIIQKNVVSHELLTVMLLKREKSCIMSIFKQVLHQFVDRNVIFYIKISRFKMAFKYGFKVQLVVV